MVVSHLYSFLAYSATNYIQKNKKAPSSRLRRKRKLPRYHSNCIPKDATLTRNGGWPFFPTPPRGFRKDCSEVSKNPQADASHHPTPLWMPLNFLFSSSHLFTTLILYITKRLLSSVFRFIFQSLIYRGVWNWCDTHFVYLKMFVKREEQAPPLRW